MSQQPIPNASPVAPSPRPAGWWPALSSAFRNRGFVVVFSIMLVAACGLNAAIQAMGLHFQKQAVPLRMTLDRLPRAIGPWIQVQRADIPIAAELQHELGTKDYLTRDYIDTRLMNGFDPAKWDALDDEGRARFAGALYSKNPKAFIRLHMAFYTGLVDTVAHVPERCYVGSGFDPVDPQIVDLNVFKAPRPPILKAKYATFVDRTTGRDQINNVAYLFQVNGSYEYDSLGGVRLRLQNITERYGYYCKIELMTMTGKNPKDATDVMSDFLSFAMPSIEKALPDWTDVTKEPSLLNSPHDGY